MNDEKLRQSVERGVRFKEWCESPEGLFAVFKAVERNYLETFASSGVDDFKLREQTHARVNALRDIRRSMEVVIADGASSQAIIAKLSSIKERKTRKKVA